MNRLCVLFISFPFHYETRVLHSSFTFLLSKIVFVWKIFWTVMEYLGEKHYGMNRLCVSINSLISIPLWNSYFSFLLECRRWCSSLVTNIPTRLIIQMQRNDIIRIIRILHAIIWSKISNISHHGRAARGSDVIKRRRKSSQAAIANNSLKQSLFRDTYNDFLVFNFNYIWSKQQRCLWKLSRKICGIWERVCCALLSR